MSNTEIEAAAAAWFAKREAEGWTPEQQSELAAWLEQSTAHRIAFLRVCEAWKRFGELDSLTTDRAPGAIPDRGTWVWSPLPLEALRTVAVAPRAWFHRIGRSATAAMTLVVLAAVGLASWYVARQGSSYRTEVGQVRSIPLEDGSHVTLDTGSRIQVAVTANERRIDLIHGDAYFEVAKDPMRPFVVSVDRDGASQRPDLGRHGGPQRRAPGGGRAARRRRPGDPGEAVSRGALAHGRADGCEWWPRVTSSTTGAGQCKRHAPPPRAHLRVELSPPSLRLLVV